MHADPSEFYRQLWSTRPESLNEDELARRTEIERLIGAECRYEAILDVGCGTGWLASSLSAHGPVLGVDPSEEAVSQARRRFPDLEFRMVDPSGPLGAPRHDLVVCSEVIEHVVDPHAFMSRLGGALRPGGLLVLTTPNKRVRRFWEAMGPVVQPIENWLDGASLARLAAGAGLVEVRIRSFHVSFTSRGRYRLVNSARLRRLLGRVPAAAAEALGWGLYLSLRARMPS
ncbi:MAG TPA: class I SAM-dependent methyltransferase [Candidatus Polarisedimenticolia bacterium]|nr:class I SAM-dependent methyltransferase [Candidatus Polarisedimenticolia bacterium]